MFWGNNTSNIVKIEEIMTKEVYLGILKNHAIPSGSGFIDESKL